MDKTKINSKLIGTWNMESQDTKNSDIYCHGVLLDTVQMSGLFKDNKTLVDMPLKCQPDEVLNEFHKLFKESNSEPSKEKLSQFIQDNFYDAGHELDEYVPPDWDENPSVASRVQDKKLSEWTVQLNILWKTLGRKMKHVKSEWTSLLYVPHPFIVPGDRFREFYYWDSYWVINGLLICDMIQTVKGMIQNFISLVVENGMVPNGGRIYYLTRSQPPFLIPMVDSYYEKSKDVKLIQDNIQVLETEYNFWLRNRSVEVVKNGKTYLLARYKAGSSSPRPEGYEHDVTLAEGMDKDDAAVLYNNIASACESGWDFSTRWFRDYSNMATICTQDIAPVDLNSILGWNAKLLAKFFNLLGNKDKYQYYTNQFKERKEAIEELIWNDEKGSWFDVNITNGSHRIAFYISNVLPLFTDCYDAGKKQEKVNKFLAYIKENNVTSYPGGIPTSLNQSSSQQWDFPNAWPPSVHMFIEGLYRTGVQDAMNLATELAQTWVKSNYKAWVEQNTMFEKYSVVQPGSAGGGGEYSIQAGFGWTNGVILMLLDTFGHVITTDDI